MFQNASNFYVIFDSIILVYLLYVMKHKMYLLLVINSSFMSLINTKYCILAVTCVKTSYES